MKGLEGLIGEQARIMSKEIVKAAEEAESEEDIRHAVNTLIDAFIKEADLNVKGRHEYGLAGGRIDSKYGGVVIEYKFPKGPDKLTENKEAPGVKAVVEQVKQRFKDLQAKEYIGMERILGVGCDGNYFVFVRMRGKQLDVEAPQPVTSYTVERLLRALVSLGARGLSFTPDNLTRLFGSESQSAQEGIRRLHNLIKATDSPKAQTFFHQWQILYGEVCGYDLKGQNDKVRELAEHYHIPGTSPAELLFAVHTYYAIFMKLLAAEIVATFSPLGTSTLMKLIAAPTSEKLRDELHKLEQGGIWSELGIHNFLEGDLFAWYLDAWNDNCAEAVRAMTRSLDQFDPTTLSVDPAESRDLLKLLYHQLFPKSVRHGLGEYYTPDWLAELVLDELGYDGDPDKRLLDPACGSGTFLVMALNRIKVWFEENRHVCGYSEDELLRKILRNIIGFDLNPLAVMAARTNYLMAIRDLLRYIDEVELPVYLCDSIMTPSEYGDLFVGKLGNAQRLKTSAGDFNIPTEVAGNREHIGRYADTLEFCILNSYSPDEFIERCKAEAIPATEKELHKKLYRHLQQLDADNKNGVWARIIKNAFAPLFVGKVDYVAGNPPWVLWDFLPDAYRDSMKPLWVEYGLFSLKGLAARHGGSKKDLSMIFTYSAVDNYLEKGGKLGFVIKQSLFKTQGAGDGFRRLQFTKENKTYYLNPLIVEDLRDIQVFEGATSPTAVFICEKSEGSFRYPVPYIMWRGPSSISQDVSLDEVHSLVTTSKLGAIPVDPEKVTSPWLTAPPKALSGIQKVIGQSNYKAHTGCCTWLNTVYWIRILDERPNGELLIENLNDLGGPSIKVQHVQTVIESDLVYPLLREGDVKRWYAEPSTHIILAQDPKTRIGFPEAKMKQRWPKTFAYLKQFEGDPKSPKRGTLRGRSGFKKYFKPSDPFYSMYDVDQYTMAEWKVVWSRLQKKLQASVSGLSESQKVVVAQETVTIAQMNSLLEAHYFTALFNSTPCNLLVCSYSTGKSFAGSHVMNVLAIPSFDKTNNLHTHLAELSRQCHAAAEKNDTDRIAELEAEIDEAAANLWGITATELKAIQNALREM